MTWSFVVVETLEFLVNELRHRIKQAGIVLALNFIGVTLGTTAFAILWFYVRRRVSGTDSFGGICWMSYLFPLLILLLGILSACCIFYSRRGAINVAKDFHMSVIKKAQQPNKHIKQANSVVYLSSKHNERHIPTLYARHTANVIRLLLEASLPLLTSIFAILSLLYINIKATVALLPLSVAYLICFRNISKNGARVLKRYQETSHNLNVEANNDEQSAAKTLELLYNQTLLSRKCQLTNAIVQISSMVWLIFVFDKCFDCTPKGYSLLLASLVALRYLWKSLRQLTLQLAEVIRFSPSVRVYAQYASEYHSL